MRTLLVVIADEMCNVTVVGVTLSLPMPSPLDCSKLALLRTKAISPPRLTLVLCLLV